MWSMVTCRKPKTAMGLPNVTRVDTNLCHFTFHIDKRPSLELSVSALVDFSGSSLAFLASSTSFTTAETALYFYTNVRSFD